MAKFRALPLAAVIAALFLCTALDHVGLAAVPDTRTFELVPIAPGNPPVKDRLMFDDSVRRDGNAAVGYMRALIFLRPQLVDQVDKAYDTLTLDDSHFIPMAQAIQDGSNTITDMMDVAAHRRSADWDEGIADRGYMALLPELNNLRALANLLRIRAELQIRHGNLNDAITDIRLGFELGHHLGQYRVLIGGLVGEGINSMSTESLVEIMDRPDAPNLYWSLASLPQPFFQLGQAMSAERVELMAASSLLDGTDTKQLSGQQWRMALWQLQEVIKGLQPGTVGAKTPATLPADVDRQLSVALGLDRVLPIARQWYSETNKIPADNAAGADPITVVGEYYRNSYHKLHSERDEIINLPYPQLLPSAKKWSRELNNLSRMQPNNPFLKLIGPFDRPAETYARVDRTLAALTTVEAIRSYAASHDGKLPAHLEDMTDTPAPINPRSGTPFGYQVNGDTATLSDPQPTNSPLEYTIKIRAIDSPAGL